MNLIWHRREPNVVSSVEEQTAAAADLARIDGQERLADPRTNPAVRALADQLRNEQHRRALGAEHSRKLRRHRVGDRRAEHAEHALEALQAAREASSAARSVLALHQGRDRFMGVSLAASLVLSIGSAMGVAAFARQLHAPSAVGYIAEVGMVGMSTTVITYRSHLAQHGGKARGWQAGVLWLLMIGPLVASMLANLFGAGPVGIACSVGAAAFSLLSYVIADTSAAALLAQAGQVTGADEADLRAIANGDDLFSVPVADRSGTEVRKQVSDPVEARSEGRSETQVPDLSGTRSETDETDRSESRSETRVPDPIENGSTDRSVEQVSDPTQTGSADLVLNEVPDPQAEQVSDPEAEQVSDQAKPKPKPRKRTPNKPKPRPLERLAEAQAADRAYLAEHGRHIPAEKLASALRIGKPAALELVKQVRGAQMDIAK